jgi:hypothetical protein
MAGEVNKDTVVSSEELEKALDNALGTQIEDLEKAKKTPKKTTEEEPEEEPEPEEEGYNKEMDNKEKVNKSDKEPDFEALSKSLPETIEENEEAKEVVDAMPFVKALVDTVENQLVELTKAVVYFSEKLEEIEGKVNNSDKIGRAEAKLVKSISERIDEIGGQVNPTKSFLGEKITIMKKSEGGEEEISLTKSEAMDGLTELCKSEKINMLDVTKYESMINNGRQLPESVIKMISSTKK